MLLTDQNKQYKTRTIGRLLREYVQYLSVYLGCKERTKTDQGRDLFLLDLNRLIKVQNAYMYVSCISFTYLGKLTNL